MRCKYSSLKNRCCTLWDERSKSYVEGAFVLALSVSLSLRLTAAAVDPSSRDIAKREAGHNGHQRLPVDLPGNGTGRATTRIYDIFRLGASLRPSSLCRFTCIAK